MDSHLKRLQEAIASATQGMRAEELTRHLEGKWSVAEVLEHLYLTYTGTVKGFTRCLEAGKPMASKPTPRQRLRSLVILKMGYFPARREAPERTLPRGMAAEKVLAEVGPQIERMEELIGKCEAQYGRRVKLLDHPVLGPLTGREWRKFHWVHGRHHMNQIQRLRENS
jgi:hypothetical protein